jgi:hypothetical protein
MSEITNQPLYLIKFDDTEVPDETMFGAEIANKRFEQISGNWNAHLFVKVTSNSRDDSCSGSNARLASDYDALAASCDASAQTLHEVIGSLRAQRDDGLEREAVAQARITELQDALQLANNYNAKRVEALEQRLAEAEKLLCLFHGEPTMCAFRSAVIAQFLASPGCAGGEKAPAPALHLPRRKVKTEYSNAEEDVQAEAWNAALDAVQELNR